MAKPVQILVIDGQGGRIGSRMVAEIKEKLPGCDLIAVGTNSMATASMMKAGATEAATGENAVVVGCRTADVIVGPIGIVLADALLGEITPKMAVAVAQSRAKRILIPFNHCDNIIVGVADLSISRLLQEAMKELHKLAG